MGWKRIKDHYRILHHVQVTPKGICIGSGYIHDIMVVSTDGVLQKRYADGSNVDLTRYQAEMDADPSRLRELALEPDVFEVSLPVYTYSGALIIEKQCETHGYPNVTHDGDMMYENTHSPDRQRVVEWALRNAKSSLEFLERRTRELNAELDELQSGAVRARADIVQLERDVGAPAA